MTGLSQLLGSEPFGVITTILAIIGILLAYGFYLKSKRAKEPLWALRTTTLIEGYRSHLSDLEVTFKGQRVENLSVSRLAFWNQGAETINGSDIAAANPLRMQAVGESVTILDARLISTNNASSVPGISQPAPNQALIEFDYLGKDHGAVFQLVHTGTKSSDLSLRGDIKGAKLPREKDIPLFAGLPVRILPSMESRFPIPLRRRILSAFIFGLGAANLMMAILAHLFESLAGPEHQLLWSIQVWLPVGLLCFVSSLYLAIYVWRSHPPSGLEAYEEDLPG